LTGNVQIKYRCCFKS